MSCKKGQNWGEQKTRIFLELCTEKKILMMMDGKKHKHLDIFRMLVPEMEQKGFSKSAEQMKLKLKNLKLAYFKCRRENKVSGAAKTTCSFYNELDLLYGNRSSAEASSGTGIDTCDLQTNDGDAIHTESGSINVENIDDEPHEDESESYENETNAQHNEVVKKKMKRLTNLGRKSYQSTLDTYTEKWMESQKTMLETVIDRQDKMQRDILQEEMEKQREWEQKEMEKEREFQREQNNILMQTFLQSMQMLRPPMPLYPQNNTSMIPLKLISLNCPRTVSATMSKTKERTETDLSAENINEKP